MNAADKKEQIARLWDALSPQERTQALEAFAESLGGVEAFCDWVIETFGAENVRHELAKLRGNGGK
jgi:hypothetical protein